MAAQLANTRLYICLPRRSLDIPPTIIRACCALQPRSPTLHPSAHYISGVGHSLPIAPQTHFPKYRRDARGVPIYSMFTVMSARCIQARCTRRTMMHYPSYDAAFCICVGHGRTPQFGIVSDAMCVRTSQSTCLQLIVVMLVATST